jgi:hypothetical protein
VVGPRDQLRREQERHLDRDPLARVMAAHEQDSGPFAAAALADAQHLDRAALDAAADLPQLGDVRPGLREPAQILLQAGRGMIAGDGLGGRERPHMLVQVLQPLDAVPHALHAVGLRLRRAHDQVVRLDLPHVQPERQPQEVGQRGPRARGRDLGDQLHAFCSPAAARGAAGR